RPSRAGVRLIFSHSATLYSDTRSPGFNSLLTIASRIAPYATSPRSTLEACGFFMRALSHGRTSPCSPAPARPDARASLRSHTADRRVRAVHGEHGLDGDLDVPAGDRGGYRRAAARTQARAHVVPREPRRLHSHQRLDRRSLRLAQGLRRSHRHVHDRVGALRLRELADSIRGVPLP